MIFTCAEIDVLRLAAWCKDLPVAGTDTVSYTHLAATKILKIRYLSPDEFMDYYRYSDADRNWTQLMVQTLQQEVSSTGSALP